MTSKRGKNDESPTSFKILREFAGETASQFAAACDMIRLASLASSAERQQARPARLKAADARARSERASADPTADLEVAGAMVLA